MLIWESVHAHSAEPSGLEPAARRLTLRLFKYWNELRGTRTFPARGDIRFDALPELSEFGFAIAFDAPGSRPTVSRLGSRLRKHVDMNLDARSIQQSENRALSLALNMAIRRFPEVIEQGRSVDFDSDRLDNPASQYAYRTIMLPFSEDGRQIDFILGAIRYKEKLPVAALPDRFESDLTRCFQECRELVSTWRAEEMTSQAALYQALERAYQLHFEAMGELGVYEALCATFGVNLRSQFPFTALIKLVFGRDCDKALVSEYAACLSFAKRNGQRPGTLREFIDATEGGLRGCAAAERAARRTDRCQGKIEALQ